MHEAFTAHVAMRLCSKPCPLFCGASAARSSRGKRGGEGLRCSFGSLGEERGPAETSSHRLSAACALSPSRPPCKVLSNLLAALDRPPAALVSPPGNSESGSCRDQK